MVCWTGGKKGNKNPTELQKTKAKTIPPESKIRNIQSSGGGKQNRKASEVEVLYDRLIKEANKVGSTESRYHVPSAAVVRPKMNVLIRSLS